MVSIWWKKEKKYPGMGKVIQNVKTFFNGCLWGNIVLPVLCLYFGYKVDQSINQRLFI